MRRLMLGVALLSTLAVQPAMAQRHCANVADQAVFEVQALRSSIMVLATGCQEEDRYNAFIRRFQSDLQANERAVSAYFKRRFGGRAQHEQDRFVTDLANAVSRQGSQYGGDFCPRNGMIFNEVMALRSSAELADFAAGKDLIPAAISVCNDAPAAAAPAKAAAPKPAAKPAAR